MFIYSGRTARIDSLPIFTPVKLPSGEISAVMENRSVWTYVLNADGSALNVSRETTVEVMASNYDIVIAGLQALQTQLMIRDAGGKSA